MIKISKTETIFELRLESKIKSTALARQHPMWNLQALRFKQTKFYYFIYLQPNIYAA